MGAFMNLKEVKVAKVPKLCWDCVIPWRLHVGLNLRELLEAVQELHELGVLLAEGAVQLPVLVQQLVHNEVGESQAVAGEPRPRTEKILTVVMLMVFHVKNDISQVKSQAWSRNLVTKFR